MSYTAENYIEFIEWNRRDKLSQHGLESIAKEFRSMQERLKNLESSSRIKEIPKQRWYKKPEIKSWLKSQNYSEEISEELSQLYADHMQLAYEKGKSHHNRDSP